MRSSRGRTTGWCSNFDEERTLARPFMPLILCVSSICPKIRFLTSKVLTWHCPVSQHLLSLYLSLKILFQSTSSSSASSIPLTPSSASSDEAAAVAEDDSLDLLLPLRRLLWICSLLSCGESLQGGRKASRRQIHGEDSRSRQWRQTSEKERIVFNCCLILEQNLKASSFGKDLPYVTP